MSKLLVLIAFALFAAVALSEFNAKVITLPDFVESSKASFQGRVTVFKNSADINGTFSYIYAASEGLKCALTVYDVQAGGNPAFDTFTILSLYSEVFFPFSNFFPVRRFGFQNFRPLFSLVQPPWIVQGFLGFLPIASC